MKSALNIWVLMLLLPLTSPIARVPAAAADDTQWLQSQLDNACAQASTYTTNAVQLPSGTFQTSFPLLLNCSAALTLTGSGEASTQINGNGAYPVLFIEPPNYTSSLGGITGPSLVAGPGGSLAWEPSQNYYLNLKDVLSNAVASASTGAAPLNGLSQVTIEGFFMWKPSATQTSNYFVSSDGAVGDLAENSWNSGAFFIAVQGSSAAPGVLSAGLNIGGIVHTLTPSGPIQANTPYHVALQFDGATISLYLNGALVASQAAYGTLTEGAAEDIFLGGHTEGWPDLGSGYEHWSGNIDSFRISSVARYAGNFPAPTSKFSGDSSTILLLNFVTIRDAFIQADYCAGANNAWLAIRNYELVLHSPQTIQELTLFGGNMGIMSAMTPQSLIKDVQVTGSTYVPIKLFNNDFLTRLENVTLNPGRYDEAAFEAERQAGDLFISSLHTNSGYFAIVLAEGSAYFEQPWVGTSDLTEAAMVFKQETLFSDVTVSQPMVDTENGGNAIPLTLVGDGEYVILGGDLEAGGNAPALQLIPKNMRSLTIYGTHAELSPAAPQVVDFAGSAINSMVSRALWFSPTINGSAARAKGQPVFSRSRGLIKIMNAAAPLPTPSVGN